MMEFEKRYIGDAVTASFDGYHIVLDLSRQGDPHIRIAMEPEVLAALQQYVKDIQTHMKAVAEQVNADPFQSGPQERP